MVLEQISPYSLSYPLKLSEGCIFIRWERGHAWNRKVYDYLPTGSCERCVFFMGGAYFLQSGIFLSVFTSNFRGKQGVVC